MLTVLVHGDDPVPTGRGHSGQVAACLAVVAAQPDGADEGVLLGERPDHDVTAVRAVVVHQEYLGDHEWGTGGSQPRLCIKL